jgi:ABC-type proline/glycine betaine transport system ATPase subunit
MHKELGVTFVMVTHDLFEAFRLGSRVVIMNEGEIVQVGSPNDIITNPANSWVKKFVEWEQLLA